MGGGCENDEKERARERCRKEEMAVETRYRVLTVRVFYLVQTDNRGRGGVCGSGWIKRTPLVFCSLSLLHTHTDNNSHLYVTHTHSLTSFSVRGSVLALSPQVMYTL